MTNLRGFTLIEILVVVAIISILTYVSSISVISFQKQARLDSFTKEFASTLEMARNRSVTGDIPEGVIVPFETYTEPNDELPFWLVDVAADKYRIYSKYKKSTDAGYFNSVSEDTQIPAGYLISPNVSIAFERLTGKTAPVSFTVSVAGYSQTESVSVDDSGLVKIP